MEYTLVKMTPGIEEGKRMRGVMCGLRVFPGGVPSVVLMGESSCSMARSIWHSLHLELTGGHLVDF